MLWRLRAAVLPPVSRLRGFRRAVVLPGRKPLSSLESYFHRNKDVFLWELMIRNANDNMDRLHCLRVNAHDNLDGLHPLSPSDHSFGKDATLDIRVRADKDIGVITITDSGIGMTREELLRMIDHNYHSEERPPVWLEKLDLEMYTNLMRTEIMYYSALLVAEKVAISTKSPLSAKQYVWECEKGEEGCIRRPCEIREESDPEKLLPRGTRITLYLQNNDKGFAHPEWIQNLVKKYSQFVSFPIYTWQEKGHTKEVEVDEDPAKAKKDGEDQTEKKEKKTKQVVEKYWDWDSTNETQPIWLRNPKEVTTEEYNEFYRKRFSMYGKPLPIASSHITTEGLRSILYIPGDPPKRKEFDYLRTGNIRFYVNGKFISEDFDVELFPPYLWFVKGVVESDELPLNVSAAEFQPDMCITEIMKKRLEGRVFDMIHRISLSDNREDYEKFWEKYGPYLKSACEDQEILERLAPRLHLFSLQEKAEFMEKMKAEHKHIVTRIDIKGVWKFASASDALFLNSDCKDREIHKRVAPLLRFFSSQSEDVMISLDEYVENMKAEQKDIYYIAEGNVASASDALFLEKFLEKNLEVLYLVDYTDWMPIDWLKSYKEKNFVDIRELDLEDIGEKDEEKEKVIKQEFVQTCEWIKKHVGDRVDSVQISNRLSSSTCCCLVGDNFLWPANMRRYLDKFTTRKRKFIIFKINPNHTIIQNLNAARKRNPEDKEALEAIEKLFHASQRYPDIARRIYEMVGAALSGKRSAQP